MAVARDRGETDDVLGVTIDQRRDGRLAYHVDATSNQGEVVFGEVDDPRRVWNTAIEPRLYRMTIRGRHVDRARRHQRTDVIRDERVRDHGRLLRPRHVPGRAAGDHGG